MTLRYYIAPTSAQTIDGRQYYEHPNYFPNGTIRGVMHYGAEPVALVYADLTALEHTALMLHLDVIAIDTNLDGMVLVANLLGLQQNLETKKIPAAWITATTTWRDVLRVTAQVFQFNQRYRGENGNISLFHDTIGLTTVFNTLSQLEQERITTVFTRMGFAAGVIKGTDALTAVLKASADAWGDKPIGLRGQGL